jgi:hydrogenase/urease accessory protein HupE
MRLPASVAARVAARVVAIVALAAIAALGAAAKHQLHSCPYVAGFDWHQALTVESPPGLGWRLVGGRFYMCQQCPDIACAMSGHCHFSEGPNP